MEGRLPFARGTYTSGAVEVGAEFYDPSNKQWLQIIKNTDTVALAAKRVVKWEDPELYAADYAVAEADGPVVAGVVDPLLGTDTVPVNGYCFAVVGGIVTAAIGSGTDLTSGALMIVASTAIAANEGKMTAVDAVSATLSAELIQTRGTIAVSQAVVSSDSTNDAQIRLSVRR